ncbi:MAG: hypothetical protein ABIQ58_07730 [Candidatus Limnocylindrales bacterium]
MTSKEQMNMRNRTSNLVIAVITTVILAGCAAATAPGRTGGASRTASAASTAAPSAAPVASVSPPAAAPAGELDGPPIRLTQGIAHVTTTGGAVATFDLVLTSGMLIPGSNVILAWSEPPSEDSGDDSLRIQAPSRAGVYPSAGGDFGAPQISFTTGRVGTAGVPPQFAPVGAECIVTLTRADAAGVEGILDCQRLTTTENVEPVDLQATFAATP